MGRSHNAFTLVELLVSIAVLTLIVLVASSMVNSASVVTNLGYRRMDADSQVRPVLGRMAVDFAQMIKRVDVDSYTKGLDLEAGNDHIAFFSQVRGYYPAGPKSPFSLVAYRINGETSSSSLNKLERMGKGLLWNGVSTTNKPLIFGPPGTLAANWPYVTNNTSPDPDSDYEMIGPQIFRFEYFYLLKTGAVGDTPGSPGMQNVAAIAVTFAAIDPKSRSLLTNDQITTLISELKDFDPAQPAYDLTRSWHSTLDSITNMPRTAINNIRIYQRYLHLTPLK